MIKRYIPIAMKDRILQFLKSEGISPAEFADKIGVQRSSVSHVLNGRNYPSASFIQKMLGVYKTLNSRWLLLGEGSIFETKNPQVKDPLLFKETIESADSPGTTNLTGKTEVNQPKSVPFQPLENLSVQHVQPVEPNQSARLNSTLPSSELNSYIDDIKDVERIVFFFKDKTFAAYTPSK